MQELNKTLSKFFIKNIYYILTNSLIILLLFFSLFTLSCYDSKKSTLKKKEILIYCGITMIRPMTEIATIIEKSENCTIIITKGGSGNLLNSILYNKKGDLYLPGSEKYYNIIEEKHKGLIIEKTFVGHNKAVIFVQKNNPKGISSDLSNLSNKEYGVIIGNPESGSIGKETKNILTKAGIYIDVIKNTINLTTDSKDLLKAIKNNDADIAINWFATSTWDNNSDYIDTIEIAPEYIKKKKLIIGLLKYSKHKKIAKAFMGFANSEKGKKIFKKHGLYFDSE